MMITNEQIENPIRELIDHAYDTGYYSGKKEDGQPHHQKAIADRESTRRQVVDLAVRLATDRSALLAACKQLVNSLCDSALELAAQDYAWGRTNAEVVRRWRDEARTAIAAAEPNGALPKDG